MKDTSKKALRRGHNEGNIRQRTDGRWEVRLSAGIDYKTGKPRRTSTCCNTRQEAIAILQQQAHEVRTRAGATPITEANYEEIMAERKKTHNLTFIDDTTPQGKFRTALYWERGFELAFEGQRKYDLIRWGVLGKALKLFGEASSVNKKETKPYPAYQTFKEGKHELFPIPLKEIQSNHKLEGKNNPGY